MHPNGSMLDSKRKEYITRKGRLSNVISMVQWAQECWQSEKYLIRRYETGNDYNLLSQI